MRVLQRSQVCFTLLESQDISAGRNKCASSSMSGWETKNIWGWCLPPAALARPCRLPSFLPTTAKAAWLLPVGSSWRLYLKTLLMCKLSSSVVRETAANVLYLLGQSPTKWSGSRVINAWSLSRRQSQTTPAKGLSLECATCRSGSTESV